ncbi:protein kinase domain-containing protein [Streptomyces sp. NBC_01465]|uniref:protein kinase domain-containing protein n=1 Tax=Streptomyces sp. NBC_01465 TaxID=2903878 RepID=UPI002E33E031|nr:hypothetical protein [Streptomyces sp. NBC_01465]
MEFVPEAIDLQALVRQSGPLPPAETARIGLAVLDALMAGHRIGILHRDVKPANILLAPDVSGSPYGRVLLTDYGIALQPESREPRLTSTAGILGTPGFLAPERARGEPPTPAADLFSLGATLYLTVEGHGAYDREDAYATLTALLTEDPAPLVRAGELAPVLHGLLNKDPVRRTAPEAAARALERVAQGPVAGFGPAPPMGVPLPGPSTPAGTPPQGLPPAVTPQAAYDGWNPYSAPVTVPEAPRPARRKMIVLAVVAAVVLALGGGVWTALALGGGGNGDKDAKAGKSPTGAAGSASASASVSATGPVFPYGTTAGQCVSAVWPGEAFKGTPNLGAVNCAEAWPDGQVMTVEKFPDAATAGREGADRCRTQTAKDVAALPDAGAMSVGDCWRYIPKDDTYEAPLTDCSKPHTEQVVASIPTPQGMSRKKAVDSGTKLCGNAYESSWAPGADKVMLGWLPSENDWNAGFTKVICTVARADGKDAAGTVAQAQG